MATTMSAPHAVPVAEAVRMIMQGRFRNPPFQRPFTWSVRQTSAFFDSIMAGFPTGALTVLEGPAEPEDVRIGFVTVRAPADPFAWRIVDGTQRLGALASVLLAGSAAGGGIRLAYDLESGELVEWRPDDSDLPHRLPLGVIADSSEFWRWVNAQGAYLGEHIDRAVDVRTRIMDHQLVLVRMAGIGSEAAAEVFVRLNTSGLGLTRTDMFHARHPDSLADSAAVLRAVSDRLSATGFGRVPTQAVLDAVLALGDTVESAAVRAGGDTRPLTDAEPVIARSLVWLHDEAAIPHLSVWRDHLHLLPVITRFFHMNPVASARSRILLRRWLWRTMARPSDPAAIHVRSAVHGDDSMDAFRLLRLGSAEDPGPSLLTYIGERLALTLLKPLSLSDKRPMDVTTALEIHGGSAFRSLGGTPVLSPADEGPLRDLVLAADTDLLAGHAMTPEIAAGLMSADPTGSQQAREHLLARQAAAAVARSAEWGASDRPAISDLIVDDESSDDAG